MTRLLSIFGLAALVTACATRPVRPAQSVAAEQTITPEHPVAPDGVHQVMILVTINKETGVMTHAQVVGGFADNDACTHAAPGAATIVSADPNFDPNDVPIVLCPNVALGTVLPPSSQPSVTAGPKAPPLTPYKDGAQVQPSLAL
jgi:hypothetical protein